MSGVIKFCPKCGNPAEGMKFCGQCGCNLQVKNNKSEPRSSDLIGSNDPFSVQGQTSSSTQKKGFFASLGQAVNESVSKSMEAKREQELFEERIRDTSFNNNQRLYFVLVEKIEEKYSALLNLNGFDTPAADALIAQCQEHARMAIMLRPKWDKYGYEIRSCCGLQRMAMIYEKQGRYMDSAQICCYSIQSGFPADGTKGGMLGRMTRMLKKGGLEPTEEMKVVLATVFLE